MPNTNLQQTPAKSSGSWAGFHYHNLYQCCPRKFFFRFILRLQPEHTPYALVQGSAFHDAKEAFYKTADADAAIDAAETTITSRKNELETEELQE